MYILGLQGGYNRTHDAAACLIKDDQIIAFAEEERFSRRKRSFDVPPISATRYCLKKAGIEASELDAIAFGFSHKKGGEVSPKDLREEFLPKRSFGQYPSIPVKIFDHHLAHAASTFYVSGFSESAVLVVDGVGNGIASSIYRADSRGIKLLKSYPDSESLGHLYSSVAIFIGLGTFGAGKLMGLAAYGQARYVGVINDIFNNIAQNSFSKQDNQTEYSTLVIKALDELGFKRPSFRKTYDSKRNSFKSEPKLTSVHKDLAASVQAFIEAKMVDLSLEALRLSGSRNLCLAGGVALNCVANSAVENIVAPKAMFVQPAAEDSGIALGSALLVQKKPVLYAGPYLGQNTSEKQIENYLKEIKANYIRLKDPAEKAAGLLADGKLVGWFQGAAETGPRALGHRSILANPQALKTNYVLNQIKGREVWRPFGPSVTAERAGELFLSLRPSPYMLKSFKVEASWQKRIPAVVHVDGTTRPQIVRAKEDQLYHKLIKSFEAKTGIPAVLNTSFNYAGEPIVSSVADAIRTFYSMGLDCLIINDFLLEK